MRILIIGSEGVIGKELVKYLESLDHEVFCSDIKQGYRSHYIQSDISNPIDLYRYAYEVKPEVIYFLSGIVSRVTCESSPSLAISTNLTGIINVIQLCLGLKSKLIFFSTSEVYGNIGGILSECNINLSPNNVYGITKLMSEQWIRYYVDNYKLKAVIARPIMIYGKEQSEDYRSALIRFVKSLLLKEKIVVHNNSKRSWLYIDDAIILFEKLLYVDSFEIINIGNNDVVSMHKLASMICNKLSINPDDYIMSEELPARMTLEKMPNLNKQELFLGYIPKIKLEDGLDMVISDVKKYLGL